MTLIHIITNYSGETDHHANVKIRKSGTVNLLIANKIYYRKAIKIKKTTLSLKKQKAITTQIKFS